jgi:hypothetical protein
MYYRDKMRYKKLENILSNQRNSFIIGREFPQNYSPKPNDSVINRVGILSGETVDAKQGWSGTAEN